MSKLVIGVTGLKGAGKNSLCAALAKHSKGILNYPGTSELSFAEPLYRMMKALLGFAGVLEETTRENKETIIPELGVSRRQILQTLGTEWGRALDPNLWLKIMAIRIKNAREDTILIPDLRFDNEALMLAGYEGVIIDVKRPGLKVQDTHASEKGILPEYVNITVVNDGTETQLDEIAKRTWELVSVYLRLGKEARRNLFPMTLVASTKEELTTDAPPVAPVALNTVYETALKVMDIVRKSGVVFSCDRDNQVTAELRKQGLLPP